jgi:hypothetical protein
MFLFYISGGFYGCEHAVTDVRCRQSARKFYNGEAFDSGSKILTIEWYLLLSAIFIYWRNI